MTQEAGELTDINPYLGLGQARPHDPLYQLKTVNVTRQALESIIIIKHWQDRIRQ